MRKFLSLLLMLFMGMTMWAGTVTIWEEDWSTAEKNQTPSQVNSMYSETGTGTKIYLDNFAGGTSPELLVGKGGGSFTATINLNDISGELILEYNCNKNIGVSSSIDGVTVSTATSSGNRYTRTITVPSNLNVNTFVITFTQSTSQNARLDNIILYYNEGAEPPTSTIAEIATAADFIALENNKKFKFMGNLVCIQDYIATNANGQGQSHYLYVADETGGIVIYNPDSSTPTYETTDVIPGGWTAIKTFYKNLPEAASAKDLAEATTTQHLDPIEMTIDAANNSTDYGAYIIIKNVLIRPQTDNMLMEENGPSTHDTNVMITDGGGNDIILYSNHTAPFNLPTDWETDTRYDIIGILGVYNLNKQIYPMGIKLNDEIITSIETIDNNVNKITYYNMQGIESIKPFNGVNIVVTEYNNGIKKNK